jgi:antitoxin ParD1/3/4
VNISISLTPDLVGLIESKVASGRYKSTSEVVGEALRLMERTDRMEAERLTELQDAWREGVESGDAGPLDFAEIRDAARHRLAGFGKAPSGDGTA